MRGYKGMTGEEFVDYLIDDNGLVEFVDVQSKGCDRYDLPWSEIAHRIWHLTARCWLPSPEYVMQLYVMQNERRERAQAEAA